MNTVLLCGLNPSGCCTNFRIVCGQRIGSCRYLRPGARGRQTWPPEPPRSGGAAPARYTCFGCAAARVLPDGGGRNEHTTAIPKVPARPNPRQAWSTPGKGRARPPALLYMGSASLLAGASRGRSSCRKAPFQPPCGQVRRCAGTVQDLRCTLIQQVPASRRVRQQRKSRWGSCSVPGVRFRMSGATCPVPGKPHNGHLGYWIGRRNRRRKLKNLVGQHARRGPQEDQARLAGWEGCKGWNVGRAGKAGRAGRARPLVECGVGLETVCWRSGTRGNLVGEDECRDPRSFCPGPDKLTGTIGY
jgi:hypothetical protein